MPTTDTAVPAAGKAARWWDPRVRARMSLDALEHLIGGLGTALLALLALFWLLLTAVACLVGVGLLLLPSALRTVRAVADRERARLTRWGPEVIGPGPGPTTPGAALRDRTTRRELGWLACHATLGLLLGLLGATVPLKPLQDGTYVLWWPLAPDYATTAYPWLFPYTSGPADAVGVSLLGLAWAAVIVGLGPSASLLQAWFGRRLLPPPAGTDLALRVAQLTATRAAALDAHATELRRIERSLHDGTQNRVVAVTVMLGAARRALARDPATADAVLERAQDAAEQALAELRAVVRSILPPVLADRSLPDALTAIAASCPVPCRIDADVPRRCAVSVEATAYFVVAEALTNIAKHSQAHDALVTLRLRDDRLCVEITDDGKGGADEHGGSGLLGIRRRIEAHDGTLELTSPLGGPTTMKVNLPCGS